MKIYFSYGKESGSKGRKIVAIEAIANRNGFSTKSVDYSQIFCPEKRIDILLEQLTTETETEKNS